jgi:hypothetical protein
MVAVERAIRGMDRPDIGERMKAVGEIVHQRAAAAVPYDPEEDPWHRPTNATGAATYVAETLTGYAAFGWPVPADLRAIWCWYEAGHWPCAMAGRRRSSTESRSGARPRGTPAPPCRPGRP